MGETTARLRTAHRDDASRLQRALDRVTAVIGTSGFVMLLAVIIFAWIAGNVVGQGLGYVGPTRPPSPGWKRWWRLRR